MANPAYPCGGVIKWRKLFSLFLKYNLVVVTGATEHCQIILSFRLTQPTDCVACFAYR